MHLVRPRCTNVHQLQTSSLYHHTRSNFSSIVPWILNEMSWVWLLIRKMGRVMMTTLDTQCDGLGVSANKNNIGPMVKMMMMMMMMIY